MTLYKRSQYDKVATLVHFSMTSWFRRLYSHIRSYPLGQLTFSLQYFDAHANEKEMQ